MSALVLWAAAPGQSWWAHVQYLASDAMEGRDTGSAGYRKAAEYVAREFERQGLKPGASNGWFQSVPFEVRRRDEAHSYLELVREGKPERLNIPEEAVIGRFSQGGKVDGGAVFAGWGLHAPEAGYDDLAGLDLHGKIAVVFFGGGPSALSAPLQAHFGSSSNRWKALHEAGAVGMIYILNPGAMEMPWKRLIENRDQPAMSIDAPGFNEFAGLAVYGLINPAHADKLLAGSGHNLKELVQLADAHKQLPRFPLPGRMHGQAAIQVTKVQSPNVAGILPGSDPKLKSEYVTLTAHLDHIGTGTPVDGDRIYNGAMDNASGVSTLLEVARWLHESGARLRRSLLFLAVTGEEKGLLGSDYFARRPTVPEHSIVADLNIDMFLPIYPFQRLQVEGLAESTLGEDIRQVADGVQVMADPEPDRMLFVRSDQYSFVKQGIPAVALDFGVAKGSPEEKAQNDWLAKHYHAPSDDTSQPVNLDAADKFNHLVLRLAERVANDSARPAWKPDSFFRRFKKKG